MIDLTKPLETSNGTPIEYATESMFPEHGTHYVSSTSSKATPGGFWFDVNTGKTISNASATNVVGDPLQFTVRNVIEAVSFKVGERVAFRHSPTYFAATVIALAAGPTPVVIQRDWDNVVTTRTTEGKITAVQEYVSQFDIVKLQPKPVISHTYRRINDNGEMGLERSSEPAGKFIKVTYTDKVVTNVEYYVNEDLKNV